MIKQLFLALVIKTFLWVNSESSSIFQDTFDVVESALHNHSNTITIGRAPSGYIHTIKLALKQDISCMMDRLSLISDPSSHQYGQYLSRDEVNEMASSMQHSTPEAIAFITAEIRQMGDLVASEVAASGLYISVKAPIFILEQLLATEFFELKPDASQFAASLDSSQLAYIDGMRAIQCFSYSLPRRFRDKVGHVFGTVQHPFALLDHRLHLLQRQPAAVPAATIADLQDTATRPASAMGFMYPQLLKSHYDIDSVVGLQPNAQLVFSAVGEYYSRLDLLKFQQQFGIPTHTPTTVGGHNLSNTYCNDLLYCLEANLDVQYITAVAPESPTIIWYEADTTSSSFTLFVAALNDLVNVPNVVSISYAMLERFLSYSDQFYFDVEAAKLALRGVTILAASGDEGVVGLRNPQWCGYNPQFPASSPLVTAVGATMGAEVGQSERVCQGDRGSAITSGGGFSNVYKTPSWQQYAVKKYFETALQSSRTTPYVHESNRYFVSQNFRYNANGRGYPDLVAAGENYIISINNTYVYVSGSSCSTPVVAGMISLINSQRLKAGRNPLGWINALLYSSNMSVARDLEYGSNNCYNGDRCCDEGFYATKGWDPVTGLGVVNFKVLHAALFSVSSLSDSQQDELFVVHESSLLYKIKQMLRESLLAAGVVSIFSLFLVLYAACLFGQRMSTSTGMRGEYDQVPQVDLSSQYGSLELTMRKSNIEDQCD